ncbi:MAG: hypothetical protein PHO63_05875 [Bacilli bacterium]|nr:hypothetical protein [Bacilli bacterium]
MVNEKKEVKPLIQLPKKVEKVILFLLIVVPTSFVVIVTIVILVIDSKPAKAISCDDFYKEIHKARDGKLYVGDNPSSTQLYYGDFTSEQQILNEYSMYLSNCELVR